MIYAQCCLQKILDMIYHLPHEGIRAAAGERIRAAAGYDVIIRKQNTNGLKTIT